MSGESSLTASLASSKLLWVLTRVRDKFWCAGKDAVIVVDQTSGPDVAVGCARKKRLYKGWIEGVG
jgi:hypothetical protein